MTETPEDPFPDYRRRLVVGPGQDPAEVQRVVDADPWDLEEARLLEEWRRLRPDAVLVLEVARRGRGPRMAALRSAVEDARRASRG